MNKIFLATNLEDNIKRIGLQDSVKCFCDVTALYFENDN